jgi:hypothetical protein
MSGVADLGLGCRERFAWRQYRNRGRGGGAGQTLKTKAGVDV